MLIILNLYFFYFKSTVKDVWFGVKSLYHHYFHPNLMADMEVEFELDKGYDGRERARNMTGMKFVIKRNFAQVRTCIVPFVSRYP